MFILGGTVTAAVLLAATAAVLLAAASPVTGAASDVHTGSPAAEDAKAVVSDKFRMVFLAGLEGSGHHYLMAADSHMLNINPDLPRVNEDHYVHSEPYYLPAFMGGSIANYAQAEDKAREEMRRLAEQADKMPWPGSVYVLHNSWSYPTSHGRYKVTQYLDLQRIAEVAEDSGVDLRVVYLRRPAKDLLVANTVHRHFENHLGENFDVPKEELFLYYARVLFTDMAVLHSFLSELSPGSIVCHDWDRLGDEDQAFEVATFISPNHEVARLVESSLVGAVSGKRVERKGDPLPFEGADVLVSRLQKKLDAFEDRYCGPKRSTSQGNG